MTSVLDPYLLDSNPTILKSVSVQASLDNLLSRVVITQVYRNQEKGNVEAAYIFPLPLNATLLDLKVTIGDRNLQGVIQPQAKAQNEYEDAIAEGDSAIMLEKTESGLYTMNVGNIQAGEQVRITFTYAELLRWQENQIRFYLPTTIAPRYGSPDRAGLEEHQIPEEDLLVENRFHLQMSLYDLLRDAEIESPSHQILIQRDDKKTEVSLSKGDAFMDRDFILLLQAKKTEQCFSMTSKDREGYTSLVSIHPQFESKQYSGGRLFSLVIDCSGSMAGDSIDQAKTALHKILTMLRPEDRFNIIAFGSTFKTLFDKHMQASEENLAQAKRYARQLDADMGGTEMEQALNQAVRGQGQKDVFLITDGEIWEGNELVRSMRSKDHRFFVVGVGSAVSEQLLTTLAEETGGACELVAPNEDMADKIARHAKRMFQPVAKNISVTWPGKPEEKSIGMPQAVFQGDTIFLFARYSEKPAGKFNFECKLEDGSTWQQEVELQNNSGVTAENGEISVLSRLAAHVSLRTTNDDNRAEELSMRYQLLSKYTSFIVIDEREAWEKATSLPEFRKVEQMLAAGWGGIGSIASTPVKHAKRPQTHERGVRFSVARPALDFDEPAYLRVKRTIIFEENDRVSSDTKKFPTEPCVVDWHTILQKVDNYFKLNGSDRLCRLNDLKDIGLDDKLFNELQDLAERFGEDQVIAVLLSLLIEQHDDQYWLVIRQAVLDNRQNFEDSKQLFREVDFLITESRDSAKENFHGLKTFVKQLLNTGAEHFKRKN